MYKYMHTHAHMHKHTHGRERKREVEREHIRFNELWYLFSLQQFIQKYCWTPWTSIFDADIIHYLFSTRSHYLSPWAFLIFDSKCQNPPQADESVGLLLAVWICSRCLPPALPVGGLTLSELSQAYFSCFQKSCFVTIPSANKKTRKKLQNRTSRHR